MSANLAEQLPGVWHLESFTLHNLTTGKNYYSYGVKPVGLLLFTAEGYMSVALIATERPFFAGESLQTASVEEKYRRWKLTFPMPASGG